jgi:hypothetical protein
MHFCGTPSVLYSAHFLLFPKHLRLNSIFCRKIWLVLTLFTEHFSYFLHLCISSARDFAWCSKVLCQVLTVDRDAGAGVGRGRRVEHAPTDPPQGEMIILFTYSSPFTTSKKSGPKPRLSVHRCIEPKNCRVVATTASNVF